LGTLFRKKVDLSDNSESSLMSHFRVSQELGSASIASKLPNLKSALHLLKTQFKTQLNLT